MSKIWIAQFYILTNTTVLTVRYFICILYILYIHVIHTYKENVPINVWTFSSEVLFEITKCFVEYSVKSLILYNYNYIPIY